MGMTEIFAIAITAVATSWYAIAKAKENRKNDMPPIRVYPIKGDNIKTFGKFVLINLEIFPAHYETCIRKISCNAEGIAIAEDFRMEYLNKIDHHKFIDVQIDVLPASLSQDSVSLFLSLKPRKNQISFDISLYKSSSRFALPLSKKTITIKDML